MVNEIRTYFVKSLWLEEIPRGQLVLKQGISLLTNMAEVGSVPILKPICAATRKNLRAFLGSTSHKSNGILRRGPHSVSQDVALPGGNALEDGSGSDVASCRGEGRSLRRRGFPPLYSLEIQFRHSRDLK